MAALRTRRLAALGGGAAVAAGAFAATDARDRRRAWALCEAAGRAATLVGVVGCVPMQLKLRLPPRRS